MQGQRSFFDPFPETVDLSQGSVLNNTVMDQSTAWNNMLNPVEGRLSNYAQSSGEANFSCVNASGHSARSFGGWDIGESSSGVNSQDQQSNDGMKMEHGYFHSVSDTRLERQFDPSNSFLHENFGSGPDGNQIARGPFSLQSSGSSHIPMNVNLNTGYGGNTDDGGPGMGAAAFTNLYKSGRSDTEASSSSSNSGYLIENDGGSSSSLGSWGLSCKRKSLEGTSAQSFPAGSSSCFPQADNTVRHTVPLRYNASSSLSILNTPSVSRSEHLNPRIGVGIRGVPSDVFPPSVTGIAESSQRHFSVRGGPMPQETVPFNLSSSGGSVRRSSRQISLNDFLDSRPDSRPIANSTNPSNQPHLMHVPSLSRNMVPFPWGGSINSRPGTSSSSVVLPGERGAEASFRNPQRTNMDPHPNFVPATETRNMVQDPTNWSLATGSTSPNGGVPSSSRNGMGPTSGSHPFPTIWIPHHNNVTQSQQRGSDFSPWTLFPSVEADAGGQRSHFTPFPSGSSSSSSQEDAAISSGVNSLAPHQTFPRSALLMEVPSDDWRALAADMEGRQRLVSEIRQVLNAMRRRENLREDYMLLDPFINGVAELQDRHRDMRLDVDNMSYEELLALEERIGDVNTGLSEETILKTMKQRKHIFFMLLSPPNLEPCCVCQEEYVSGDDIGTLDCGHDFHTDCIKQWLTQKNLCPICKMTGLGP